MTLAPCVSAVDLVFNFDDMRNDAAAFAHPNAAGFLRQMEIVLQAAASQLERAKTGDFRRSSTLERMRQVTHAANEKKERRAIKNKAAVPAPGPAHT